MLYRHFSVIKSQHKVEGGGRSPVSVCIVSGGGGDKWLTMRCFMCFYKQGKYPTKQYNTYYGLNVLAVQDQSLHHPHPSQQPEPPPPPCVSWSVTNPHVSPGGLVCFTVSATNRQFWTSSIFKHVSLYSQCKEVTQLVVKGWAFGCSKVAAHFLACTDAPNTVGRHLVEVQFLFLSKVKLESGKCLQERNACSDYLTPLIHLFLPWNWVISWCVGSEAQ